MNHKRLLFMCLLPAWIALATQAFAAQSAPTNVEAAPGNESAAVSFVAPTGDGSSNITGYTVTAYTGGAVDSNAIDITTSKGDPTSLIHIITGLTNDHAYTFTVTATNSLSPAETSSPSSASNSVTPSATPCSAFAGQWNVGGIMSGKDSPYSQVCTVTVSEDGTTSGDCSSNGGSAQSFTGNLWAFPDGIRSTIDGGNSFTDLLCQTNTADTVMACTATSNDGTGSSFMSVATKQADSYIPSSDLPGQWVSNSLDIASYNDGSWGEGDFIISAGGNLTVTGSSGNQPITSGLLSLSPTGELTCASGSCSGASFGYMDAGKTVVAGATPSLSNGDIQLQVMVKNAGPYTLADLSGNWASNELRSDGTWSRTAIQVYRNGSYIGSQVNSDGTTSPEIGRLAVSNDGVVSCAKSQPPESNCSDVNLVMDAGKTVMTGTQTLTGPVYSMQVFTKTACLFQNATHLGGGWLNSKWFGSFYANSYPWIYSNTLGWLYPNGTSDSSIWFWDAKMNAWWWTSSSVYPWLYSASDGSWLYYIKDSSNPTWFYNVKKGKWVND